MSDADKKYNNGAAPLNIVWIVFFVLLIFSPDTLTDVWQWVQDRDTWLEVLLWSFTLPYMLALAVWESDWATWLRILVVISIALFWTGLFNSKRG